jgi:hypothetical protein
MKTLVIIIAGLAMTGAAMAQVDPTRPMVTGRGNVAARPQKVIVTNQTATASQAAASQNEKALVLEKYVVTGSLIRKLPK